MTPTLPVQPDPRLAAIHDRLAPIRALDNGTVHMEPVGIHFHVVTKNYTEIRFWLVEQSRPSSGVIQSEIDLARPLTLVEPYTQAMMLGLLWQPQPSSAYMAGFGGGRLALLLHHYFPDLRMAATELEPQIVQIAERYFGVRQDERLHVDIEEARTWLAQHEQRFDLILVDVFLDNGYTPYRLATVEFFQLCKQRLQPGGVLVVNILDSDRFKARKTRTLAAVFPAVWRFYLPEDNLVLFAQNPVQGQTGATETTDPGDFVHLARELEGRHAFDFPFSMRAAGIARVPAALAESASPHELFYDDAPPEEYFDGLPSFATPFNRVDPDLPCPCGSGLRFAGCHGAQPAS